MKVSEAMTRDVKVCQLTEPLTRAAQIMWEQDCGCVPVLSGEGQPVGMITDRDVCMAAYHEGGRLDQVPVGQAMSPNLFTCTESDDLKSSQEVMREHHVRRLPVVDKGGKLGRGWRSPEPNPCRGRVGEHFRICNPKHLEPQQMPRGHLFCLSTQQAADRPLQGDCDIAPGRGSGRRQ